jgi:hypothetical protein
MWGYIKQFLAWDVFDNLEQLHQKVDEVLLSLTSEVVSSVAGFQFILDALSRIFLGIWYYFYSNFAN